MKQKLTIHSKPDEIQAYHTERAADSLDVSNQHLENLSSRPLARSQDIADVSSKLDTVTQVTKANHPKDVIAKLNDVHTTMKKVQENTIPKDVQSVKFDQPNREIASAFFSMLKGDKGEDAHTPTEDELLTLIKPLIPEPIKGDKGENPNEENIIKGVISKIKIPKDGKDGKNADEQTIVKNVLAKIPTPKDGINGIDGSPDTGEQIIEKIDPLRNVLDFRVLRNVPDFILTKDVSHDQGGGGGSIIRYNDSTGAQISQYISTIQYGAGLTPSYANGTITLTATGATAIGDTITGGTMGSVVFINPTGIIAQDNNNFYVQDSATTPTQLATNTNFALSINTNGDISGTDAVNIYGQYDAYLPNSAITNSLTGLNTDGAVPIYSTSSSRGTGSAPLQLQTGDMTGGYFGFGSQGASSPTYQNLGGMSVFTTGSSTNNLGGELRWYTKGDGGTLTQWLTLSNAGFFGIGQSSPAAVLHLGGNISSAAWTTNGINLRTDAATYTDTTSTGTVATMGINSFGIPTIQASSNVTYTTVATVYIAGVPVASAGGGGTVTITNQASLYVAAGQAAFLGGLRTANSTGSGNNLWVLAGGTSVSTTNGAALFAGASGVNIRTFLGGSGSTSITSGNSYVNTIIASSPTTTPASGVNALLANFVVNPIGTITQGAATVTNTASFYVQGASSATVSGQNYAAWINGLTRIDLGSDATGDLVYRASAGGLARLGIGATGTHLVVSGGLPAWVAQTGVSNYTHTIFTPTTGQTITLINNQYNIVNPAGALLALTVNLPSSPANNDVVYIKFTQNVTTVTYANGTVVDGITAPTAGGLTVLTYDSGNTSWY